MDSGSHALFLYPLMINASYFIFFQDCRYFSVLYSDVILVCVCVCGYGFGGIWYEVGI